jgi:Helicase associated domain
MNHGDLQLSVDGGGGGSLTGGHAKKSCPPRSSSSSSSTTEPAEVLDGDLRKHRSPGREGSQSSFSDSSSSSSHASNGRTIADRMIETNNLVLPVESPPPPPPPISPTITRSFPGKSSVIGIGKNEDRDSKTQGELANIPNNVTNRPPSIAGNGENHPDDSFDPGGQQLKLAASSGIENASNSNFGSVKGHQAKWDEIFGRLLKYKKEHGDCLVPNRYEPDPSLGAWVSTQRR